MSHSFWDSLFTYQAKSRPFGYMELLNVQHIHWDCSKTAEILSITAGSAVLSKNIYSGKMHLEVDVKN